MFDRERHLRKRVSSPSSHVESIPFVLIFVSFGFSIISFCKMFRRVLISSFKNIHSRSNHNLLQVTEADGVRNITMVDSKTRNCLSLAMMENLIKEIKRNESDKSLRVIVLSSTGPVFSAGHNLKELSHDKGYETQKHVFIKCHELINSIIASPLPVVAKIDGLAAGEFISRVKVKVSVHCLF